MRTQSERLFTGVLVGLFLLMTGIGMAYSASIQGRVTDAESGDPLPYVNISVKGTQVGAATDMDGNFRISGLKSREYEIVVSRIGYEIVFEDVDLSSKAEADLNISMKGKPLELGENVIVVGTKLDRTDFDLPVATSTITSDGMFEKGESDLKDALQCTPSVNTVSGGTSKWFFIRGSQEDRILAVLNGDPLPSWQESSDLTLLNYRDIERAEVLRGPFAVQYGSNALSGVLNIVRKSVNPLLGEKWYNFNAGLLYRSVSNGIETNFDFGMSKHIFDLSLAGIYAKHDEWDTELGKVFNTDYRFYEFNPEIGLRLHRDHYLTLGYIFNEATDVGSPSVGSDIGNQEFDFYLPFLHRHELSLKYYYYDMPYILDDLVLRASYKTKGSESYADTPAPPGSDTDRRKVVTNQYYRDYYNFTLETSAAPYTGMEIKGGLGLRINSYDENGILNEIYDRSSGEYVFISSMRGDDVGKNISTNIGAFIQDEWSLFRFLDVITGVRFDLNTAVERDTMDTKNVFESDNSAFSGALGLVYKPLTWLNLSFNIGRAFRAPTYRELFNDFESLQAKRYFKSNKELNPEYGVNLDFNIKGKSEFLDWTLSVYDNEIKDQIVFEPIFTDTIPSTVDTMQWNNLEDTRLSGIEISTRAYLPLCLEMHANASKVWGYNISTEEDLEGNLPPFVFTWGLKKYFINKKIWTGLDYLYHDQRENKTFNETIESYYTFNFYTGAEVYKKIALNFSISNLTNEEYMQDFGGNMAPKRSYNIWLKAGI